MIPDSGAVFAVVLPEPNDTLSKFVNELRDVGEVHVFAPWHTPGRLAQSLSGVSAFARRRTLVPSAHQVHTFPCFPFLELSARAYARRGAAEGFQSRFALRRIVAELAARWLRRTAGAYTHVIAPTLAARQSFVEARKQGIATVLLEDTPDLKMLATDLDRASKRWPECPFLRNHRPSRDAMVGQAAERYLAGSVGVRGKYAWQRLSREHDGALFGFGQADAPGEPVPSQGGPSWRVLLAGPALGRSGSALVRGVVAALPWLTVWVQPADVVEPDGLLDHPRIHAVPRTTVSLHERVSASDAVLALSAVECHPAEVRAALALGRPIVGSSRALGQTTDVHELDALSVSAVVKALTTARDQPRLGKAWRGGALQPFLAAG